METVYSLPLPKLRTEGQGVRFNDMLAVSRNLSYSVGHGDQYGDRAIFPLLHSSPEFHSS